MAAAAANRAAAVHAAAEEDYVDVMAEEADRLVGELSPGSSSAQTVDLHDVDALHAASSAGCSLVTTWPM